METKQLNVNKIVAILLIVFTEISVIAVAVNAVKEYK